MPDTDKHLIRRSFRSYFVLLQILVIAIIANMTSAEDRFWKNASDGDFSVTSNWIQPVFFDPTFPQPFDSAIFDAGGIYTVDFLTPHLTDRVLIRSGMVTFLMSSTSGYSLGNISTLTPSVVVGQNIGDIGSLHLTGAGGTLHAVYTDLGQSPASFGMLAVDGSGANLHNDQIVRIGNQGIGMFTISDGGQATNGIASIGASAGAFGEVTITGPGSQWITNGTLSIGRSGVGELLIENGAVVVNNDTIIAQVDNSIGSVIVQDPATQWNINGTLDVGLDGFGTLSITNGATVSNHTFATIGGFPTLFPFGDVTGIVSIDGAGSEWFIDGDLFIGLVEGGVLEMASGSVVSVTGDLMMNSNSTIMVELASTADFQLPPINVIGNAGPVNVKIMLADSFVPSIGDSFTFLHSDTGLNGPIMIDAPQLTLGQEWQLQSNSNDVIAEVVLVLLADFDADGVVGALDLLSLFDAWGPCPMPCTSACVQDIDMDCEVGILDMLFLLASWN